MQLKSINEATIDQVINGMTFNILMLLYCNVNKDFMSILHLFNCLCITLQNT